MPLSDDSASLWNGLTGAQEKPGAVGEVTIYDREALLERRRGSLVARKMALERKMETSEARRRDKESGGQVGQAGET